MQRPIVVHPSEHGPGALMAFIFELARAMPVDGNVDGIEPEPGPEESLSLRVEEESDSEPEEANGSLRATMAASEGAEGAVAVAASVALH